MTWIVKILTLMVVLNVFIRLPFIRKALPWFKVVLMVGASLLLWPRWGELSCVEYIASLLTTLSVPCLFLFSLYTYKALRPDQKLVSQRHLNEWYFLCFSLCIVFYPPALGVGWFDPYQLGFAAKGLLLFLGAINIYFAIRGNYYVTVVLLTSIIAYQMQWLASSNLWDYLLDPIVFTISLVQLGIIIAANVRRRYFRSHVS